MANIWTGLSRTGDERLQSIEVFLRQNGAIPIRGGAYDLWDLETNGGVFGSARIFMAVDHHGSGRQLLRIRCWPLLVLMVGSGAEVIRCRRPYFTPSW